MSIVDIGDKTIAPYFLHTAPLFGFITLLNTASLRDFTLTNAIIQTSIFIFSAQIPSYFTGIMSWVDLAWPSGLVAIAMQTYYSGSNYKSMENKYWCFTVFIARW